MARYKVKLDTIKWNEIEADTNATTGQRVYHTPAGPAMSVTTILGTLPHPELDEWRERVGEEEADRISLEATTIGTYMHDMLEAHLLKNDFPYDGSELEAIGKSMAKAIRMFGWQKLQEVWAVEMPLHFLDLYAGRTDLVGVYTGKPAIMDYKTSKYIKPPEHLENYRLQMAAYSLAVEKMFGIKCNIGVNFFSIRPNEEYKKTAQSHIVVMDEAMMYEYKLKWAEILIDFYADEPTKLESIEAMMDMIG